MGKAHSKEESARRKERRIEKSRRAKRKHFKARVRFILSQMAEFTKNNGYLVWYAFDKDKEKEVMLRANFTRKGKVDYGSIDGFFFKLKRITNLYVNKMSNTAMVNDVPENVTRSMCTVIWNEHNERQAETFEDRQTRIESKIDELEQKN